MEEILICECGMNAFYFLWDRVRCPKCQNEYKQTTKSLDYGHDGDGVIHTEYWLRRFNLETKQYNPNWEKSKITYKGI